MDKETKKEIRKMVRNLRTELKGNYLGVEAIFVEQIEEYLKSH
jgi:hypothetical protein